MNLSVQIFRGHFCTAIQLSGERIKSGLLSVDQGLGKGCQLTILFKTITRMKF